MEREGWWLNLDVWWLPESSIKTVGFFVRVFWYDFRLADICSLSVKKKTQPNKKHCGFDKISASWWYVLRQSGKTSNIIWVPPHYVTYVNSSGRNWDLITLYGKYPYGEKKKYCEILSQTNCDLKQFSPGQWVMPKLEPSTNFKYFCSLYLWY